MPHMLQEDLTMTSLPLIVWYLYGDALVTDIEVILSACWLHFLSSVRRAWGPLRAPGPPGPVRP